MIHVSLVSFEDSILNSPLPCILKFSRETCPMCKGLNSVFMRMEPRYRRKVKFATIDTDTYPEIADLFQVDGVPTIFLFVNGDAEEVPFPENPSVVSGYGEKYLTKLY